MGNEIKKRISYEKGRSDIVVLIVIIASILGSLYGVYININSLECTTAIYVWTSSSGNELTLSMIFGVWIKYFKKIFVVWICSFYRATYIVCYTILFFIVFSVGFTSVSLFMLWDKHSTLAVLLCCLIESVILIGTIIQIIVKKNIIIIKNKYNKNNITFLIIIIIISTLLALFNTCTTNIIIL